MDEQEKPKEPIPLRTKSGRVMTDEEIHALADEAERGYDINPLLVRKEIAYFIRRLHEEVERIPMRADGALRQNELTEVLADLAREFSGKPRRRVPPPPPNLGVPETKV